MIQTVETCETDNLIVVKIEIKKKVLFINSLYNNMKLYHHYLRPTDVIIPNILEYFSCEFIIKVRVCYDHSRASKDHNIAT